MFSLIPTTAAISGFCRGGDGDIRIPGVIMESRRAEEIYERLERANHRSGTRQTKRRSGGAFGVYRETAPPIPAFGTKRLELEYTEALSVDSLQTRYSFPFKPSEYGTQGSRSS